MTPVQQRLAAFAKSMSLAFVALRVGEFVLYRAYLDIWPNHYWMIFAIGTASVVLLATTWLVLARRPLSERVLTAIDAGVMAGCGTVFGAIAVLASNRPESAYTCLVYACFMVFTRTIIVPSSGRRTAIVAGLAMFPLAAAALALALTTHEDVPGPAFFAGGLMYTSVGVAVAATGSRVIYGLRRRVDSLASEELVLGRYRLVRKLGTGSHGEVFVAQHTLLRRPTAIKLLDPARVRLDACEGAVQEMSRLRHHNTVAVYDYGRSPDGVFYFAMEYLEGESLAAVDRLAPGRVVAIAIQLCGALHEAHRRGFAHGNIRRSNVILCERGGIADVAKLTDFGLAGPATPADDLRALRALAESLGASLPEASSARELAAKLRALDLPLPLPLPVPVPSVDNALR
jgi:serine/threonine-protein kinase